MGRKKASSIRSVTRSSRGCSKSVVWRSSEKLRSLRETLPVEAGEVRDAEEQSVDDFVQEVDFALMQMKSETLAKIDEAILRLEDGTYGRLRRVPDGDRRGPPEGPALRGPVPRLPGGGGEPRGQPRARPGPSSASRRNSCPAAVGHGRATRSDRRSNERQGRSRPGLRVGRRPRGEPRRRSRPSSASCPSATPSSSRTPSCPWRWPGRARWPSSTTRCAERKVIGVVTQRDPAVDDPVESDLYRIGTLTHIHKMFKFPDGSLRLVVQGVQRFRLLQVTQYRPFLKAQHRAASGRRSRPTRRSRCGPSPRAPWASSSGWWSSPPPSPTSSQTLAAQHPGPGAPGRLRRRQPALAEHRPEAGDPRDRSTCAPGSSGSTRCWSRTSRCSRSATRSRARSRRELQKNQREYYLREQMKAIQKELGDGDDQQREFNELARRSRRRACRRTPRRRPCASWTASPACPRPPPSTR